MTSSTDKSEERQDNNVFLVLFSLDEVCLTMS